MPERLNRHDLTDEEWERLRVLLPSGPQQRGGRWADHRTVINGIFFRTRAGCPWRDLPEGFGNWKTIYNRHRRWSLDGTWEQILDGLRADAMRPRAATGRSAPIPPSPGRISMRPGPAAPGLPMTSRGALANDTKSGREAIGRSGAG